MVCVSMKRAVDVVVMVLVTTREKMRPDRLLELDKDASMAGIRAADRLLRAATVGMRL